METLCSKDLRIKLEMGLLAYEIRQAQPCLVGLDALPQTML